jgi:hypothetical protein
MSLLTLPTPDAFPAFPYDTPYPIQVRLMRHLYESIENERVTVVESPTGTVCIDYTPVTNQRAEVLQQGKTLSLLCASLTWLTDNKKRARMGGLASSTSGIVLPFNSSTRVAYTSQMWIGSPSNRLNAASAKSMQKRKNTRSALRQPKKKSA